MVKAAAKSASCNMFLSKGDIPATLNPAIMLLGVAARGNASDKIPGMS